MIQPTPKQAAHEAKLAALQARFPNNRISSGYIGNCSTMHDDRSFMLFTDILNDNGDRIYVPMPEGNHNFDLEEVTLFLQDKIVHRRRYLDQDLSRCPCSVCFLARARKRWEEGSSPIRPTEITENMLKRLAAEWSQIAGEPVRVEHIKGAIYGFTSELGALRLERKYRPAHKRMRALESPAYGWTFALEV